MVSELVTNAIRHPGAAASSLPSGPDPVSAIELTLEATDSMVRISVRDRDPTPPRLKEVGVEAAGGRGIFLVAAFPAPSTPQPEPGWLAEVDAGHRPCFRSATAQGQYGKVHSLRQRLCMTGLRCQVCGGPADRTADGVLWLLDAPAGDLRPGAEHTAHPPVCRPCAHRAVRSCAHLRARYVAVRASAFRLRPIRSTLGPTKPEYGPISPRSHGPIPGGVVGSVAPETSQSSAQATMCPPTPAAAANLHRRLAGRRLRTPTRRVPLTPCAVVYIPSMV